MLCDECERYRFPGNPGNVDLKLFYAIFRQADSMQSNRVKLGLGLGLWLGLGLGLNCIQ